MTGYSRTPFVSRSREAGMRAGEARQAWLLFLSTATRHAEAATRGRPMGPDDARNFGGLLVRLKAPFPIARLDARATAEAAQHLALALRYAGPAELAKLGEILLQTVRLLDGLLYDDARAIARRISGEGEGED